ncbi:hypothetical protein WOLCODRAFT_142205 [Wolfiporia cocos MD-104 SS10]|uniref:Uncharacterized protein n=1 Tax=Wolfiporia cocos (strain MD-104) TaxID=742152 RepID=A0A2H3J6Z6_WOLCO|nr:hypothetical protein WOLCODRAFT_142205 [Wolfiporia cocos MD-104 SS10]
MAGSSRYARTTTSSPPQSTTGYSNAPTLPNQRINIVTRLAIEGKSKKGWDGASLKVYLKLSLPMDSITPGATIALFPEENLKILNAEVHPLDGQSVPYNFSSSNCPMLHKAARALNLAARLTTTYVPIDDPTSLADLPPLHNKYTGDILVTGYHVSYVCPKEFPREPESRGRRGTTFSHFMAAIDVWVPFLSKPPHAPYMLSIPVPRCLSNTIRLRIFPPSAASSIASLSSADEDGGAWELTSDPHVTRSQTTRFSRSSNYSSFADDESSDTSPSAGFAEGCGIQGTFPSTERIRVRWAAPAKAGHTPETADGRRRVGIKEVKGEMTCVVLETSKSKGRFAGPDGVLMKLEYTATCKGVRFPGVATLLGMDVALDAGEYDISWAPGRDPKWTVTGGAGFTGSAIGGPSQPPRSRQPFTGHPPAINILPASPDARGVAKKSHIPTRKYSHDEVPPTPSPSLLRASLPVQLMGDYSFENSPVSTPTMTTSSLASLLPDSERSRREGSSSAVDRYSDADSESDADMDTRPPKLPVTIHLNMNELAPPPKNVFTFSISGTVLVTPRKPPLTPDSRRSSPTPSRAPSDDEVEQDMIAVPRFCILHSDKEAVSTTVRNEAAQIGVHVYTVPSKRTGASLKTILAKGNQTSCGTDCARILVRPLAVPLPPSLRLGGERGERSEDSMEMSPNRTRSPPGGLRSMATPTRLRDMSMSSARLQPRRDGPLMIPSVTATITPILGEGTAYKNGYAVQLSLPAPSDADSEWLEFGLALPGAEASTSATDAMKRSGGSNGVPRVDIASASVEGVPVRFQTSAIVKPQSEDASGLSFEQISGKEWICWVSVHVGEIGGGKVEIIYLVKGHEPESEAHVQRKGKEKAQNIVPLDILLPSFALPVGRLQVDIQIQEGFEVSSLQTNLIHQQSTPQGRRLLNYALAEFHYPRLSLTVVPLVAPQEPSTSVAHGRIWKLSLLVLFLIPVIMVFSLRNDLQQANAELRALRQHAAMSPSTPTPGNPDALGTVTVISTIATGKSHGWTSIDETVGQGKPAHTSSLSVIPSEMPPASSRPAQPAESLPPSGIRQSTPLSEAASNSPSSIPTSAPIPSASSPPAKRWTARLGSADFNFETTANKLRRWVRAMWSLVHGAWQFPMTPE